MSRTEPSLTQPNSPAASSPAASSPAPARTSLVRRARTSFSELRLVAPAAPTDAGGSFAWLVTGAHLWILVGLFVDGWFHINRPEGESFFTPWHAILYSGVLATVVVHLRQQSRYGGTPPGYAASLAGGVIVLLAGFVDGVWHTVLGVEADLEALLSPPHLLLITAGTLVFAGPLRAALRAPLGAGLPTALSAAFVVTGLGFFTQYANPFAHLYPVVGESSENGVLVQELQQVAGVSGVIVWAVLIGGSVAILKARTRLVPGSLFVAVAVPSLFLTTQQGTYGFIPAIVLAALAVEALGRRLTTAQIAGAASTLLILGWVLTLVATEEVRWSLELLTGSIGSAAAAGYLVGWLVQNGGRPAEQTLQSGQTP